MTELKICTPRGYCASASAHGAQSETRLYAFITLVIILLLLVLVYQSQRLPVFAF